MRNLFRQETWIASCLALVLAGCPKGGPVSGPLWSQSQADPANSGQVLIPTKPAQDSGVRSTQIFDRIEQSSAVLAPDGSIYVASFSTTPNPFPSSLLQFAPDEPLRLYRRTTLAGQLTTPAVDAAGNVYVTEHLGYHEGSHLLSFDPQSQSRWDRLIVQEGVALAPPKILDVAGGSLIFQPYSGGASSGWHLMVTNDQNAWRLDVDTCNRVEGGFGAPGFQVPGIDLGPPYPEDPAVAVRAVDTEQGRQLFLVVAANRCSVAFFRLDVGRGAGVQPTITRIASRDTDAARLWSPVISLDGLALIADSDKRVTAYDVTTADERWHFDDTSFVSTPPTLMPPGNLFAYVASYEHLTKLDLATGHVEARIGLIGPVDNGVAAGATLLFASTASGLFTYDLDLALLAFSPFPGGRSAPAIGPAGQVYVASTDGWFREYPGP